MVTRIADFDRIVYRCHLALRLKYQLGIVLTAEQLFEKEIELIRKLGFEDTLIDVVEFGDQLLQWKSAFHAIGSGGSSVILFLLGLSEVEPVHNRTHFQRLWQTSSGEPPLLEFVVASQACDQLPQIPHPSCVSVHPMTVLEAIPALLEQQLGEVDIAQPDKSTLLELQSGNTEGIFQMESNEAQSLLSQIRPTGIKEIAMMTALNQIGNSHPEVVDEFIRSSQVQSLSKQEPTEGLDRRLVGRPLLFQETIMSLLRTQSGLPWEETYRFVLESAKGRMTDQHDLWKPVLEGLEQHNRTSGEVVLRKLVTTSNWVVCRAHHVANAITSYKAAYFKTHHREDFEKVRQQTMAMEQGA